MIPIRYIDGKPECPECRDGITLHEIPEQVPGQKLRWILVCPVCEIRLNPPDTTKPVRQTHPA